MGILFKQKNKKLLIIDNSGTVVADMSDNSKE